MSNSDFSIPNNGKIVHPGVKSPAKKAAPAPDQPAAPEEKEKGPVSPPPEYSEDELMRVFDQILFTNGYTESFPIRANISVTLRTRTSEEIDEIQRAMDKSGFNLMSSLENMRSIMNLTYALVDYKGTTLPVSYEEKEAIVKNLPGPLIGLLLQKLSKFDHKVMMACREGEENF